MANLQQKPIDGYPNYFISEDGKVWNSKKKIFLKPMLNRGYCQIILCRHSKHKTFKMHRLVALAFIPNPQNKREVNHKDGNKENNCVSNLEWSTRSENNLHRYSSGLFSPTDKMLKQIRLNGMKNKGKVYKRALILNTNTGIYYDNITEAANSVNAGSGLLGLKLHGKRRNNTAFILA